MKEIRKIIKKQYQATGNCFELINVKKSSVSVSDRNLVEVVMAEGSQRVEGFEQL